MEPRGLTHLHEVSGPDDAATDDEIFGNVAESKSPAQTYLSNQLCILLVKDCSELGKTK